MKFNSSLTAIVSQTRCTRGRLAGYSILVLKDEPYVAKGIETVLSKADARKVVLANTLETAWHSVRQQRFDAALLDLHLTDGYAFPLAFHLIAKRVGIVMHSNQGSQSPLKRPNGMVMCARTAVPADIVDAVAQAVHLAGERAVM